MHLLSLLHLLYSKQHCYFTCHVMYKMCFHWRLFRNEMFENKIKSEPDFILTPELKFKVSKEVRDNMEITPSDEITYVIVVAIHKDNSRNIISKISCKKGLPLGGYIYDSHSDAYYIDCVDYLHLGFVPFSFIGRIKGIKHWKSRIPMSESVIKKYLNPLQKKELKNFKNHFRVEDHDIQYIQMIDPN